MKKMLLSVRDVQEIDRRTVREYGIPSILLMENAGGAVAQVVEDVLFRFPKHTHVAVLCGGGNNGGDGFVAARHLFQNHHNVNIYMLADTRRIQGDAGTHLNIVSRFGVPVHPFTEFTKRRWQALQHRPVVIVDAIVGTGFRGALKEPIAQAINEVNDLKRFHNAKVTIVSVDVPSGLNGDTGAGDGPAIRADITVTFVGKKRGLLADAARPFVGRLEVRNIGVPERLLSEYTQLL